MIGLINFTHSDPLFLSLSKKEGFLRETPGKILDMILGGELEGGMISLVSLLENGLELFKGANIHSVSTTMSTILVSRGKGLSKKMEIAVTSHTRTTEFYLEMVLKGLGIEYKMLHSDSTDANDLLNQAEYALVIGDEALRVYSTDLRIILDTGYEFSRLFHMQPLYAALAYKREEKPPAGFADVDRATAPERPVVEEAVEEASKRLNLDKKLMRRYFSLVKYDYVPVLDRTVDFVSKHIKSR